MGLLDTLRSDTSDSDGGTEQLAPDDPDPQGQARENEHHRGSLFRLLSPRSNSRPRSTTTVETEPAHPPAKITKYWEEYYHGFSLSGAPLRIFNEAVAEPGYRIEATIERETDETDDDGDPITETVTDEGMEAALRTWASKAAIHAGNIDEDLSELIHIFPARRRGKGTVLMEKVRPESGDGIRSLMCHDPSTFKIYKRENQNVLVQPDDDVDSDHPRTDPTEEHPEGKAAAYVQYDDDLNDYDDDDPVAFAADDLVKFTYGADEGDAWGTSVYASVDERIESLQIKLRDRDASVRLVGHPLRVYSSPQWTPDEAREWAENHRDGELTSRKQERRRKRREHGVANPEDEYDPGDNPLANSTEFIGGELDIEVRQGEIADIGDAVLDDVRMIFAAMPVSRFRIAYAEKLNQFVVEPQFTDDNRRVDQERRYIERKLHPVFEEVADALADGDEYDGDVSFRIEPAPASNPLAREDFPRENLNALTESVKELLNAGADTALVRAILDDSGYDLGDIEDEYGETYDPEEFAPEMGGEETDSNDDGERTDSEPGSGE
jgi:hypothetical protein